MLWPLVSTRFRSLTQLDQLVQLLQSTLRRKMIDGVDDAISEGSW